MSIEWFVARSGNSYIYSYNEPRNLEPGIACAWIYSENINHELPRFFSFYLGPAGTYFLIT